MDTSGYRLVDADQHYYEPYDCFSRHIEAKYRDRAITIVKNSRGLGTVRMGERRLRFMSVTPTDYIGRPGALRDYFDGRTDHPDIASALIDPKTVPGYVTDRDARLQTLDEQGVEATIMLPTLGVAVEHDIHDDVEGTYANLRAFNRWVQEDWGFGDDGRIFSVAMLSLLDPDLAVAEVDRLVEEGVRLVNLRPGPLYGRSPADPVYDPFWARLSEAGILVTLHVNDSGYPELFSQAWGEQPRPPFHEWSMFQHVTCLLDRPITDMLAAMILHNLFGRFPGLQVLSLENGSDWVPALLKKMDKAWRAANHSPFNLGGSLDEAPSEVFKRHVYVAPFFEEDIDPVVDALGAERLLLGSDFPHPEGVVAPVDFLKKLEGRPDDEVRRFMRDNAAGLLGLVPATR